jgi:hypothetical protein
LRQILEDSQASVNVVSGLVLVADLIQLTEDGDENAGQTRASCCSNLLTAHHLVVNLVSWRVLLENLEELLRTGTLVAKRPLLSQAWCKLQAEYSQRG